MVLSICNFRSQTYVISDFLDNTKNGMYIDNQSKSNYSFGQYIYIYVWPKQGGDRILSVDKLTSHAA